MGQVKSPPLPAHRQVGYVTPPMACPVLSPHPAVLVVGAPLQSVHIQRTERFHGAWTTTGCGRVSFMVRSASTMEA
jgi:hypothetical protein